MPYSCYSRFIFWALFTPTSMFPLFKAAIKQKVLSRELLHRHANDVRAGQANRKIYLKLK